MWQALVVLVTELAASNPAASAWLEENRNMWSWVLETEFSDQGLRSSLQRHLNTSEEVSEKDPEKELVNTVYEQLKAHGPYYNSRKDWCIEAVNAHAGQCTSEEAVAWIFNNFGNISKPGRKELI